MNSEEINSNISINNDGVEIEGIFTYCCAYSWTSYHIQAYTHKCLLRVSFLLKSSNSFISTSFTN